MHMHSWSGVLQDETESQRTNSTFTSAQIELSRRRKLQLFAADEQLITN